MDKMKALTVVLLLFTPLVVGAQTRVREVADVTVDGGRYTVEANSGGQIVLTMARGFSTVGCWMRPSDEPSWLRAQRATLDTVLSIPTGERVELAREGDAFMCSAHILRVARSKGSDYYIVGTGAYEIDRVTLQVTKKEAENLLAQIATAANAASELAPAELPRQGVVGGTGPVNTDQPYFEFQVEKQVQQIPGTDNLRYPDALRAANVEGEVLAQFVVDANGQYEPGTFKVLESSHELFTQAVKDALPKMRFYPAEVGGKKVKQLVQRPFTFSLSKG